MRTHFYATVYCNCTYDCTSIMDSLVKKQLSLENIFNVTIVLTNNNFISFSISLIFYSYKNIAIICMGYNNRIIGWKNNVKLVIYKDFHSLLKKSICRN